MLIKIDHSVAWETLMDRSCARILLLLFLFSLFLYFSLTFFFLSSSSSSSSVSDDWSRRGSITESSRCSEAVRSFQRGTNVVHGTMYNYRILFSGFPRFERGGTVSADFAIREDWGVSVQRCWIRCVNDIVTACYFGYGGFREHWWTRYKVSCPFRVWRTISKLIVFITGILRWTLVKHDRYRRTWRV